MLSCISMWCSLELCGCWGFNSLKIDSPRLHKLIVIDEDDEHLEMLEISAPYVSILEIMIHPEGRKFWLKNISAVVEVKVGIAGVSYYAEGMPADAINAVNELFEEIQHVKKLHMKTSFFQFVSKMVADGWQLEQQSRRLYLKIDNLHGNHINTAVLRVLESCPKLETLQLHEVTKEPPLHLRLSMSDDLNCDLLHLKIVGMKIRATIDEISVESFPMLMLVQILLRRAVALEKR